MIIYKRQKVCAYAKRDLTFGKRKIRKDDYIEALVHWATEDGIFVHVSCLNEKYLPKCFDTLLIFIFSTQSDIHEEIDNANEWEYENNEATQVPESNIHLYVA